MSEEQTAAPGADERRPELLRLRTALEEIAASHIPDQPAAMPGSELVWAQQHVARLRRIAFAALRPAAPAPDARIAALEAENARLRTAGRWLVFCAETSGGVAGRDEGLVKAIDGWEAALAGTAP